MLDVGDLDEDTLSHEAIHVAQYERWGMLLFFLYPLASLAAWLRGGHPYRDNRFERAARQEI
ncbi:MAG TPA: hypothetical protein VFS18_02280 [Actinomycetota bacterium]|nr:hypothetical protein [Actinomycetota bacterium]